MRFAVTGNPIFHSKSPDIFNHLFKHMKIPAHFNRIAADSSKEALFLAEQIGVSGLNVTAPFKEEIIPLLDEISPAAKKIGAVNCILLKENHKTGYNTDWIGVSQALKAHSITPDTSRVLLLGGGGAAKAAAYALHQDGFKTTIINRTFHKAKVIAKLFSHTAVPFEQLKEQIQESTILISTLPGHCDIITSDDMHADLTIFDAAYHDSFLTQRAKESHIPVISGFEWLLHQAIPSCDIFTGQTPDSLVIEKLRYELQKKHDPKKNIALIGFMLSGKTKSGIALKDNLNMDLIDTDKAIEKIFSISVAEFFSRYGESAFRLEEKKQILLLKSCSDTIFSLGGGAVIDQENRETILSNALTIWLYSSIPSIMLRNDESPDTRPLLNVENAEQIAKSLLCERIPFYFETSNIIISTDNWNKNRITEKIVNEISEAF